MKILKILGIVVVLLVVVSFLIPSSYNVTRSIVINKPVAEVYDYTIDFNKRPEWDPWIATEPGAEYGAIGSKGQLGSGWQWKGTDEGIGQGKMTIESMEANKKVHAHLVFMSPMESESEVYWDFESADGGTKATWSNEGEIAWPMNFFTLFMDGMLGAQFESGLNSMKEQLER